MRMSGDDLRGTRGIKNKLMVGLFGVVLQKPDWKASRTELQVMTQHSHIAQTDG